jgi:hypothetical protein
MVLTQPETGALHETEITHTVFACSLFQNDEVRICLLASRIAFSLNLVPAILLSPTLSTPISLSCTPELERFET